MTITHSKVSAIADTGDPTLVQGATDWNADHVVSAGAITTTMLAPTAVTPGSYTNTNLTVGSDGRITAASTGTGGGGISGLTATFIPVATSGTSIGNSPVSQTGAASSTLVNNPGGYFSQGDPGAIASGAGVVIKKSSANGPEIFGYDYTGAGPLALTIQSPGGQTNVVGDFKVNTNKLVVAASTGAVTAAGNIITTSNQIQINPSTVGVGPVMQLNPSGGTSASFYMLGGSNDARVNVGGFDSSIWTAATGKLTQQYDFQVAGITTLVGSVNYNNNRRQPPVAITASGAMGTNVETQVVAMSIPANTLIAGSTFTATFYGTFSAVPSGTVTANFRLGPTTLTGPIVATVVPTVTTGGVLFECTLVATVRTAGASGTSVGSAVYRKQDPTGAATPYDFTLRNYTTAPVTINTTVANLLEATFNPGTSITASVHQAFIRQEL